MAWVASGVTGVYTVILSDIAAVEYKFFSGGLFQLPVYSCNWCVVGSVAFLMEHFSYLLR